MRRRAVIPLLGGAAVAWQVAARRAGAQLAVPVVGILTPSDERSSPITPGMIARLAELGFEDGRNVALAIRSGARQAVPAMAADLARLRPAVMVVIDPAVVPAVRDAMPATPIVSLTGDPVTAGFAQSLARPGGLITGVAVIGEDLGAKRLEILAEILPHPARVLFLRDPAAPISPAAIRAAAPALGITLRDAEVAGPEDIERVLGDARASGLGGIGVLNSPLFFVQRHRIIALAAAARLPTIFHWVEIAHDGALLAYGVSLAETSRLLAGQVARILGGERPADIPVEQPTRIALAVNLRVARALGLAIPPALLARADDVIE